MKITIYMVMSIDAIIAENQKKDIRQYTSDEDHDFFISSIQKHDAVIMGHNSINEEIQLPKFIITSKANDYTSDDTHIYMKGTAKEIYDSIKAYGFENVALLGGAITNHIFIDADLVDEIFLTIEPIMLGAGLSINPPVKMIKSWKLLETRRLNECGTTVLHFVKDSLSTDVLPTALDIKKENKSSISLESKNAIDENNTFWDERASLHIASEYYQVEKLGTGNLLRKHELTELGDVRGKRIVHLQCHIGTDSLSLAKLGASVIGLDYSAECVKHATELGNHLGIKCEFIQGNVFEASTILGQELFDMVYVSYGSLSVLPNLTLWANEVSKLLKPGGYLYLSELHPVSALLSDNEPKFILDYFDEHGEKWTESGSYADGSIERSKSNTKNNDLITWNWTLAEIFTAVLNVGLKLEFYHEQAGHIDFRYPYLEKKDDGKWYSPKGIPNVPATFTLKAIKE